MRMPGAGVVFMYSRTFMAVSLGGGTLGITWRSLPRFAEFAEESGNFEPIEVHYFRPCCNKVLHKGLLCIVRRIDFGDGPKLGVRTEDQVHTGSGPLYFVRRAIAPIEGTCR